MTMVEKRRAAVYLKLQRSWCSYDLGGVVALTHAVLTVGLRSLRMDVGRQRRRPLW